MTPITLSRASAADLDALVPLAIALGRQHQGYDPHRFRIETFGEDEEALVRSYRTFFETELARTETFTILAREGDAAVGYAFGGIEPPSLVDLADASGWIHDLYLAPMVRGRGLGGRLLDSAIEALRALGARDIMLMVSPKNEAGRHLFERRGFGTTMLECRLRE